MKPLFKFLLISLAAMVFAIPLPAQEEPAVPPTEQEAAVTREPMDKMADSVTKMAEMCMMMMMQQKMSGMPAKMGAAMVIGVLLLVALALFIVLEVQWIRYWSRVLKERR
jgi:hypothetical protein